MKCPKCGKEIANDSQFCEFCGAQARMGNKLVDIRWALLPAMLMSTILILLFWCESEFTEEKLNFFGFFLTSLLVIIYIVAIWVAVKRKVAYSFGLLMVTFFLLNGALVFDTLDAVCHHERIYKIESSNQNIGVSSLEVKSHETSMLHYKVYSMWKSMIAELENQGIDDIDEYSYEEHYYRNNCHDIGLVALGIASWIFFFYFIYAVIAHKKGWTF